MMEISFVGWLVPVTEGVVTVCVAYSHDLPRYSMKAFCILDAVHSTTATGYKVLGVLKGAVGRSFFASHSTKWSLIMIQKVRNSVQQYFGRLSLI